MIDFMKLNTSTEDMELISKIADRALGEVNGNKLDLVMTLEVAHSKCPLMLRGLLEASELDFLHDVSGICAYLDHSTGELTDDFLPRYAQ